MSDGPSAGGRNNEVELFVIPPIEHSDDEAVLLFANAMRTKLKKKRKQGRGGWDDPTQCSVESLRQLLEEHVAKGDPVDIANFAMMIWHRTRNDRE